MHQVSDGQLERKKNQILLPLRGQHLQHKRCVSSTGDAHYGTPGRGRNGANVHNAQQPLVVCNETMKKRIRCV